jgi:hypothetical protein
MTWAMLVSPLFRPDWSARKHAGHSIRRVPRDEAAINTVALPLTLTGIKTRRPCGHNPLSMRAKGVAGRTPRLAEPGPRFKIQGRLDR